MIICKHKIAYGKFRLVKCKGALICQLTYHLEYRQSTNVRNLVCNKTFRSRVCKLQYFCVLPAKSYKQTFTRTRHALPRRDFL